MVIFSPLIARSAINPLWNGRWGGAYMLTLGHGQLSHTPRCGGDVTKEGNEQVVAERDGMSVEVTYCFTDSATVSPHAVLVTFWTVTLAVTFPETST